MSIDPVSFPTLAVKASGRNEFTGTTDFQSVAWCYSTDWKSVVQIADGKLYPAARLKRMLDRHVRQKTVGLNSVLVTDVDFFTAAWLADYSGDQERDEGHQTAI